MNATLSPCSPPYSRQAYHLHLNAWHHPTPSKQPSFPYHKILCHQESLLRLNWRLSYLKTAQHGPLLLSCELPFLSIVCTSCQSSWISWKSGSSRQAITLVSVRPRFWRCCACPWGRSIESSVRQVDPHPLLCTLFGYFPCQNWLSLMCDSSCDWSDAWWLGGALRRYVCCFKDGMRIQLCLGQCWSCSGCLVDD